MPLIFQATLLLYSASLAHSKVAGVHPSLLPHPFNFSRYIDCMQVCLALLFSFPSFTALLQEQGASGMLSEQLYNCPFSRKLTHISRKFCTLAEISARFLKTLLILRRSCKGPGNVTYSQRNPAYSIENPAYFALIHISSAGTGQGTEC